MSIYAPEVRHQEIYHDFSLEQPSVSTQLPVWPGWGSTRDSFADIGRCRRWGVSDWRDGKCCGETQFTGGCIQYSDSQVKSPPLSSCHGIYAHVCKWDASEGCGPTAESEEGKREGRAGFSFHTSIHSLKDAGKYMKILANFQLCYMNIMSYFLYFSVFFKIRMEVMVGTLHL